MSTFFRPNATTINNQDLIIYPMVGIENVLPRSQPDCLENHLEKLYSKNTTLKEGAFHIVILWADETNLMTDVWLFLQLESEDTGYTVDCKTFRSLNVEKSEGITASDGLIMLGKEAELSEKMRKAGLSPHDFVYGQRPSLPNELNPTENFYQ